MSTQGHLYLPTGAPATVWVERDHDVVGDDHTEVWRARIRVGALDVLDAHRDTLEAATAALDAALAALGAVTEAE